MIRKTPAQSRGNRERQGWIPSRSGRSGRRSRGGEQSGIRRLRPGRPGSTAAPKHRRPLDRRSDARRDGGAAERAAPDRRSGRHVRQQLRLVLALLPVASDVPDRAVLAQQRRARERIAARRLREARLVQHPRRLVAAVRLLHDPPRQVPERVRPTEPHGDTCRLERVARLDRPADLPLLRLQAQRRRNANDVLRGPAAVVLPDRRLPRQGERDHPAACAGGPRDPDDPPNLGTPVPAPRHKDKLKGTPLPQPPSFNEADVSDKPAIIRRRPLINARRFAAIQEMWQQRRETLMAVDEAVAAIVETLRSTGELDNTLIVFTSDNGFFHGEHRIQNGKVLWYEPSIHLPLLMRWTGNGSLPRGVHRSQLVMNVDDAETILDAANARPGRVVDGVSLLPLWRDGGKELGRDLLIDNTPGDGHFDGIRTLHYKYAEYVGGQREFYDLRKDPYALESQHANPAYEAIRASLATRLHNLVTCAGPSCRARPPVGFTAVRHGRCGAVSATVTGSNLRTVGFSVNGRRVATDSREPFRTNVQFKQRSIVRARVTTAFDQVVTLDRAVRACP